jgi:Fe-S oxidoreductase
MVKILDVAHVRFTMLENEVCCGLPLYDEGFREEAREQAVGIGASIASTECKVLVSLCPTCVWAFRDVYPDLGVNLGGELKILHSSEFIFRLLTDGGLNAGPRADGVPHASDKFVVTYHDPCSMGRILHKYETPREVIGSLPGVELREMRWARDHAHCCGGASVHTLYPEVGEPIATTRAGEALETGAGVLVSTCPSCEHHLSEAAGDGLEVLDVAELVASILEL